MTKQEAVIVSAYTGFLIGDFGDVRAYAEKKMGRPLFTHEFADKELANKLQQLSKEDFCSIRVTK